MIWRVVITDTESASGVAPAVLHFASHDPTDTTVCDDCPGPHLECWTPGAARKVADLLNRLDVEVCE